MLLLCGKSKKKMEEFIRHVPLVHSIGTWTTEIRLDLQKMQLSKRDKTSNQIIQKGRELADYSDFIDKRTFEANFFYKDERTHGKCVFKPYIHCTWGRLVSSHSSGNWEEKDVIVITPLIHQQGRILRMNPIDTMILDFLDVSDNATIICDKEKLDQILLAKKEREEVLSASSLIQIASSSYDIKMAFGIRWVLFDSKQKENTTRKIIDEIVATFYNGWVRNVPVLKNGLDAKAVPDIFLSTCASISRSEEEVRSIYEQRTHVPPTALIDKEELLSFLNALFLVVDIADTYNLRNVGQKESEILQPLIEERIKHDKDFPSFLGQLFRNNKTTANPTIKNTFLNLNEKFRALPAYQKTWTVDDLVETHREIKKSVDAFLRTIFGNEFSLERVADIIKLCFQFYRGVREAAHFDVLDEFFKKKDGQAVSPLVDVGPTDFLYTWKGNALGNFFKDYRNEVAKNRQRFLPAHSACKSDLMFPFRPEFFSFVDMLQTFASMECVKDEGLFVFFFTIVFATAENVKQNATRTAPSYMTASFVEEEEKPPKTSSTPTATSSMVSKIISSKENRIPLAIFATFDFFIHAYFDQSPSNTLTLSKNVQVNLLRIWSLMKNLHYATLAILLSNNAFPERFSIERISSWIARMVTFKDSRIIAFVLAFDTTFPHIFFHFDEIVKRLGTVPLVDERTDLFVKDLFKDVKQVTAETLSEFNDFFSILEKLK
jgi:hypothetical protein